jgi:carbamoyl-phosphate synthase small subunit
MICEKKNAALIFPDGSRLYGYGIGKKTNILSGEICKGEICFNTSITGYQEIITDPSYCGQIIVFTFPHIGNVGVNDDDIEAIKIKACGVVMRENITSPSNYRSKLHFNLWLIKNNITGICGIDTRALTKRIRNDGAKSTAIIFEDNIDDFMIENIAKKIAEMTDLSGVELASVASENKNYSWGNQGKWDGNSYGKNENEKKKFRVVAIDYGAKLNILRCLTESGCEVFVVPAKARFDEIMSFEPDGIFLSNGPGDPAETGKYAIPIIQKILHQRIPLFGICLGHQLLALSAGGKTIKMHQGHRGANHPVQNLKTKKVEITSQNHGFCVDEKNLPKNIEITHISLFDKTIEGLQIKDAPAFSVQYHPESSPGPSDSFYLFDEFVKLMEKNSAKC